MLNLLHLKGKERIMGTMSVKEALAEVLRDMRAMSAEELRAELNAHKNGAWANAIREANEFMIAQSLSPMYPIFLPHSLFSDDEMVKSIENSLLEFNCWLAANDNSYALAA